MAKKNKEIHGEKAYFCHPDNPCGTCFACNFAGVKHGWNTGNAGCCLGLMSLMIATVALAVKVTHEELRNG